MARVGHSIRERCGGWPATLLLAALPCLSCSTTEARLESRSAELGLRYDGALQTPLPSQVVWGGGQEGSVLHVYLEGDGTPFVRERWVAADPSPRRLLMLELMAVDPSPALYLGRPCYHGVAQQGSCTAWHWTHGRYSEEVVESLTRALHQLTLEAGHERFVLIGHSGGGALAMLLAERLQGVEKVVTLAGNLDPDAWCEFHGYSRLSGSLNPSLREPLPAGVEQLHLAGEVDEVMPARLLRAAVAHQRGARLELLADCDHSSCWAAVWPRILEEELGDASHGDHEESKSSS